MASIITLYYSNINFQDLDGVKKPAQHPTPVLNLIQTRAKCTDLSTLRYRNYAHGQIYFKIVFNSRPQFSPQFTEN